MRPQVCSAWFIELRAVKRRIPGGMEGQHGTWCHADVVAGDHANHKRACRGAGAIDYDRLPSPAQRAEFGQISADPPTAVVRDALDGRSRGHPCNRQKKSPPSSHIRASRRHGNASGMAFLGPGEALTIRILGNAEQLAHKAFLFTGTKLRRSRCRARRKVPCPNSRIIKGARPNAFAWLARQ